MFKTTKEFETAMYKILISVRDGDPKDRSGLEEQDYVDALSKILDLNFAVGINLIKVMGGSGFKMTNPRVSYEGLQFIEQQEASHLK